MTDDSHLEPLIDKLLDSQATPEEVCFNCPQLLPHVRRRWEQIHHLQAELNLLFPPASEDEPVTLSSTGLKPGLPRIPGYEIESLLGFGGMGVVYRALHLRLNRPVALKMLLAGPHARREESERLVREAETVAGLTHTNVVQLYDVGDVEGHPYFTMELVEGGSLAQSLAGAPLSAREAATLVATVADAVQAAHQSGIIHRDLKPANILLTRDGVPKVSDFGLARRLEYEMGLTLTGAPMGTPSYMAPEQARGDKNAVGPTTDVYALGAILYELVTGRPPFRADTSAATLQQVVADEPVSAARLNPRTPRDLDTIILKCLQKEPLQRYASAVSLAEDLRHFERGEPIMARPIGALERIVRWLRRRPAQATAISAATLLVLTFISVGAWWYQQRSVAARATEVDVVVDLRDAEELERKGDYDRAADALQRANRRLGDDGPAALRNRLTRASSTLQLLRSLDAIRLERALFKGGVALSEMLVKSMSKRPDDGDQMRSGTPPGRQYHEAFRDAGLGAPGDGPAEAAASVNASPAREALVAALDDWSACTVDLDQQAWVLQVVRLADPDPWRNRVRDPATWDDSEALGELATAVPVAEQKPQLLVVLGARLRAKGGDARTFLKRVVLAHPTDFWANVEMGNTLSVTDPLEAIGYYRAAVAIRPETASLHRIIGTIYHNHKMFDDAIAHYQEAIRLDPNDPWDHNNLAVVLTAAGRPDEAAAECRTALHINPNYGWAHYNLSVAFERQGRLGEAVDECQVALHLLPRDEGLRYLLRHLGRWSELRLEWQKDLAANPPEHSDWFGYAELCLFLGDEDEYQHARQALLDRFGNSTDPGIAERTARACLLLPGTKDELDVAASLIDRAIAADRTGQEWAYPYYLFAKGLAEYRFGRFDEAIRLMNGVAASVMGPCPRLITAMALHQKGQIDDAKMKLATAVNSYDWNLDKADQHDAWIAHILRREAEAIIDASASPP